MNRTVQTPPNILIGLSGVWILYLNIITIKVKPQKPNTMVTELIQTLLEDVMFQAGLSNSRYFHLGGTLINYNDVMYEVTSHNITFVIDRYNTFGFYPSCFGKLFPVGKVDEVHFIQLNDKEVSEVMDLLSNL